MVDHQFKLLKVGNLTIIEQDDLDIKTTDRFVFKIDKLKVKTLHIISVAALLCWVNSVKIIRFPFARPDGSSAKISSSGSYDSFTICASISMFFNMDFNILQAENPADFQLRYLYDEHEPTFRLNLKGVPFIGAIVQPNHINTFQWETMCVAYDSTINNVTLVFRGVTVFKVREGNIISPWCLD